MSAALIGNHLWQSTLCLLVAALLNTVLRNNRAQVRYAIWTAASLKFLLPFAPLIALGRRFAWPQSDGADQTVTALVNTVSQPFAVPVSAAVAVTAGDAWTAGSIALVATLAIWLAGCGVVLAIWLVSWRRVATAVANGTPVQHGPELDMLRCLEQRAGIRKPSALALSNATLEPGVFGWFRPSLIVPRSMTEHLSEQQVEALIAHEVCHIRRHDNIVAALHMLVEAVFWFHPLVWWLERRLMDERERACDEQVVEWGYEPVVYAESILRTCELYVASPVACVAGVTGSELKSRIEAIMNSQTTQILGGWRALLLALAALSLVAGPFVVGAADRSVLRAQVAGNSGTLPAFEAASIKVNKSGSYAWRMEPQPGGRLVAVNAPGAALIRFAYNLPDFQVFGEPDWLDSTRYDISATAGANASVAELRLKLQRLLADRFKLTAHAETRELPIYAMTLARSDRNLGPRIRRSQADCAQAEQPSFDSGIRFNPDNTPSCGYFGFAPGSDFPAGHVAHGFRGLTMPALAKILVAIVRRSVVDQTGLPGYFDAEFDLMAELPPPPPPPGTPNPFTEPFLSIFTVFPEQLGLKLEARRGPVDVLVVDRAEPPTPD